MNTDCTDPFPNDRSPTTIARPLSLSAPATISLAEALTRSTSTAIGKSGSVPGALAEAEPLQVLRERLLAQPLGEPEDVVKQQPADAGHGMAAELEVMFNFRGDLDALQEQLAGMGESLVIARLNEQDGRVHIHSREAGENTVG